MIVIGGTLLIAGAVVWLKPRNGRESVFRKWVTGGTSTARANRLSPVRTPPVLPGPEDAPEPRPVALCSKYGLTATTSSVEGSNAKYGVKVDTKPST